MVEQQNQLNEGGVRRTEIDLMITSEEKSSIDIWFKEVTRGDYEHGDEN